MWYVAYLLNHRRDIKNKRESESLLDDLMEVERTIIKLYSEKKLSKKFINIVSLVCYHNSYDEIGRQLKIPQSTVYTLFERGCGRIANSLGGHFTDYGYVNYMRTKYKLSENKTDDLLRLLRSNRRTDLIRS